MNKIGLILGATLAALLFTYGSVSTLVRQGVGLPAALLIFFAVVFGGIGIVMLLGRPHNDAEKDE